MECEKFWEARENTVEIEEQTDWMGSSKNVHKIKDYILRLAKILGISDLVNTEEGIAVSEHGSATFISYVIPDKYVEQLVEIALKPPSLKSMVFTAINKNPNIYQVRSAISQKNLIHKMVEILRNRPDFEVSWAQKNDVEKIKICLSSIIPDELAWDPRFLFNTYPGLLIELVREVERQLFPAKCLVM